MPENDEKKKKPETKSLNVLPEDHERVLKITALRNQTVYDFFAQSEVREFFTHLLSDQIDQERHKLPKPPSLRGGERPRGPKKS